MSISPSSLAPPVSSSQAFPLSPSPSHGVSAARESPPLPGPFEALQIQEPSSSEAGSDDAGTKRTVLNPFAKEFVPASPSTSPDPGFCTFSESRLASNPCEPFYIENSRRPEVDGESTDETLTEGDGFQSANNFSSRSVQFSGGLSTALKKGQTGQSKASTFGQTGHGGSDSTWPSAAAGAPSTGKRNQFLNANYLLNFQYDPIPRPARRGPPPRRQHRPQPYNKELFLQANFRFLVSDFGDYMLNMSDPDKMLQWEDIAAVHLSAPLPMQCPICLESPPLCPQITSCGHIFCFPCILRYLVMGEDHKGDYIKKCPLCFATVSCKDLRTVFIENVQNYQAGDYLEFTLLNRAKGSVIPFERADIISSSLPHSKDGQCHLFSKFTLTDDAEKTANRAIATLLAWTERAQKEGGEDLDSLPYVFAAVEQLQQRKVAWGEHRALEFLSSSPPVRHRIIAQTKSAITKSFSHGSGEADADISVSEAAKQSLHKRTATEKADITAETEAAMAELKNRSGWVYESPFSDDEDGSKVQKRASRSKSKGVVLQSQSHGGISKDKKFNEMTEDVPSSWEDISEESKNTKNTEGIMDIDKKEQDLRKDLEDKEPYCFYQSADGQPLILHPLNMKCLLQHYGSYDFLPSRLQGKILEMETITQSEATRKRYRYLGHLSLTTNFQLCEVDLQEFLPSTAFAPVLEELRTRENRRRRRLKQEIEERAKEERIAAAKVRPSPPSYIFATMIHDQELPSSQGFEESLGDAIVTSASPPVDERRMFSQVTKLGFASAHDAPPLVPAKSMDPSSSHDQAITPATSSSVNGLNADTTSSRSSPMSFADVIQSQPSKPSEPESSGTGKAGKSGSKKGRKSTKILLSTAGGRRY